MALSRVLVALLLASSLTGCIVLPVGHRHHHGYAREAVVVVPAPRHRDSYDRDERYDRDGRYEPSYPRRGR